MRKLVVASLVFAMAWAGALLAGEAGGPPGGGRQGRGGRPGGFRGAPGGGMFPGMMGRADRTTDLFDAVRRAVTVPDDKKAAMENLAIEYAIAENDAMDEVRKRLNKEYLVKVVALLPAEEKPKFEKAIAAMTERDDAIAAAQKELREALDKVRTSQGADKVVAAADAGQRFFGLRRGEVPTRKMDMLRTCFVLTADQTQQIDVIREASRNAARDKIRAQMGNQGGGRPDPAQMQRMGTVFRQVRTETDEQDAKAAANLLTDAQKKDFAAGCTAVDACNKKIADAEAACRTKIVAAIGEEKANALLNPTFRGAGAGNAPAAAPAPGTTF